MLGMCLLSPQIVRNYLILKVIIYVLFPAQEWSHLLLEYTKHRDAKIGRRLGKSPSVTE